MAEQIARGGYEREQRLEEDEEDFRSCCEDDDVGKENEEFEKKDLEDKPERSSVKLFFKGVSVADVGDSSSGLSGIGVVIKRSNGIPDIQVQKKMDLYVDELVADYLALMEGLVEATRNHIHCVYAYTDSHILYDQVTDEEKKIDIPLLIALRERILEHASNLETFVLETVSCKDIERPLQLAQVAIGIVSRPSIGDKLPVICSICNVKKPSSMVISLKCSHKFCSQCIRTYVDEKVNSSRVPIRCPQERCMYYISTSECESFLPVTRYVALERALGEMEVLRSGSMYCPYPNCSVVLHPFECLAASASSSSQSGNACVECPVCLRFICIECGVPWHSSFSCEEYQSLSVDEREYSDFTGHLPAPTRRWKCCLRCWRMVELIPGRNHLTCWCRNEFCYICNGEYIDGQQTCLCAYSEDNSEGSVSRSVQEYEQWAWETFNSLHMFTDSYSDEERSQLAMLRRFLEGGFSLSDQDSDTPPLSPQDADDYEDPMKDLQQLPWLERFVSVISDDYYDDYVQ